MVTGDESSPASPPKFLETLVRFLVPPARREQVLGDLQERYQSPLRYLADAVSVVPAVISSQLSMTPFPIRMLEALIVYLSVFADARLMGSIDSPQPSAIVCFSVIAMAGLVWHDVYSVPRSESELLKALKQDFPWLKRISWLRPPGSGDLFRAMFVPCMCVALLVWPLRWLRSSVGILLDPIRSSGVGLLVASILIVWLRRWAAPHQRTAI